MDYLILRLLSSFLVGVLLSQAGSLIQLSTRNILSSSSTLGFDGLAVLWLLIFHSIVVYLNVSDDWSLLIGLPIFVFLGMLLPLIVKGKSKFEKIILLGLTFNLLVGAVFSLWQFLFMAFNLPFPVELWFGHFRFVSDHALIYLFLTEAIISFWLFKHFKQLTMFSIGPFMISNWGLDERKLFKIIFVIVSLSTFVIIGLFGAFSFLGLVLPIIARKSWFSRYDLKGELIYGSVMNGLALMLLDFLCYQFPIFGAEVPVGLIVTAIGAVSLILILWSNYKDSEIVAKPIK